MRSRLPRRSKPILYDALLTATFGCLLTSLIYYTVIARVSPPPARLPAGPFGEIIIRTYNEATISTWYPQWVHGPSLRIDRPAPEDIAAYSPILEQELSRYPRCLLWELPVRRIVLCSELILDGTPVDGFARQREGTVFLNVKQASRRGQYLRQAIHHELFHLVESAIEGTPGAEDAWARLNLAGFEYGGREITDALAVLRENPFARPEVPGFLDHDATPAAP